MAIIKEDVCIKFYDITKPLYIERDVSGVGFGLALAQTRDNMTCHRDEVPDNSILRPLHLPAMGQRRDTATLTEAPGIIYGLAKVPSLLLCQGGKYNCGPQTTHGHIQERCSHFVTKTPANSIKNTSVQGQNLINPDQTSSWQTGCLNKITRKIKMKKLRACK